LLPLHDVADGFRAFNIGRRVANTPLAENARRATFYLAYFQAILVQVSIVAFRVAIMN